MSDANDLLQAKGRRGLSLARSEAKLRAVPPADATVEIQRFAEGHVAQVFAETHRDRLRYCWKLKRWMAFDGRRWADDGGAGAAELLRAMALGFYAEAATIVGDDKRKRVTDYAKVIDTAKGRRGVLELAQAEPGIGVDADVFDRRPWLLNCLNGTVHLDGGKAELKPHAPGDYLQKIAPVEYDPAAQAPTWERFLNRITNNNSDLIGYLQRLAGYALTGVIREHVLPVFYGVGGNGKGTFLTALGDILGEHLVPLPEGMLITRKHQHHPTELMTLRGARLAVSSEINQDGTLNESRVKLLTGGDRVQARGMHRDFETGFDPTAKIVLLVNHRPHIKDTSAGMWRRVHLVPFEEIIPEEERDGALGEKLKAEAPGILAWAVRGCIEWQRMGLSPPDKIRAATAAYQEESDVVGRWIRERCKVDRNLSAPFASLYADFDAWVSVLQEDEGPLEEPITRRSFGQRLDALGHRSRAGKNHIKLRQGLALPGVPDRRMGNDEDDG